MEDDRIYSDEFLNSKRLTGDAGADEFIAQVFEVQDEKQQLLHWFNNSSGKDGLNQIKNSYPQFSFINNAGQLPIWAEPGLMKAGAVFFAKHAEMIMNLLGLLSLPYCYTAANGSMVLYLSELIRKQTTKRLYDTAIFVWEMMNPEAFSKDGNAYTEILKVRIMHATVRYYTFKSGKWDDAWGVPINQEDMAGTNLSFSLIVIRGLRMLGYKVNQREEVAFMHVWAVIGWLTGLNEALIPETPEIAAQLAFTIKRRQFAVSLHGKELTRSLTDHILSVNKSKATADDILGLMRYLLGMDVADMLAIKAPELPVYKLRLIRTINLFKSFIPQRNPDRKYRLAFAAFKQQNPEHYKTS